MKPEYFIGIDVSKLTLDIALLDQEKICGQFRIENNEPSITNLISELKAVYKVNSRNAFFCAEHMGIYNTFLQKVCVKKKLSLCLESPLHLKRSLGIQRGKNDKMDAVRIAGYAKKNFLQLKFWQPPRPQLMQLKYLSVIRRKLIKMKGMCTGTKTLEAYYWSSKERKKLDYTVATIRAIKQDILQVEEQTEQLINKDEKLRHLKKIVTSVPAVGNIIATQLIVLTNEFETNWTAKKFASYCGIAPFEYSSGTSVKGKTKVSHLANKEIKALLHMAAVGTIRSPDSFLGKYYARRVKEGKNKMSIINAIRNKIIQRIFACVRDNKCYEELTAL